MISVLFPGQGSQILKMGSELSDKYPQFKTSMKEASDALNFDLIKLINEGPETDLTRTDITQPAILAVSVATWRLLTSETELTADYMAGHSLGEYSALVCSGALAFDQAVKLVNKRGQLMLDAVPEGIGAMAAILGLEDDQVAKACVDSAENEVVSPVNYNSPGQVVIAGHKGAVERASEACVELGAKKVIPLVVSGPFHCALMKPAAEELAAVLEQIQINTPVAPVINNVDVSSITDTTAIKDALVRQLYNPVRWSETIHWFESNDVTSYVECGPGKVLAGLNKRINRRSPVHVTTDLAAFEKTVENLNS